MTVPTVTVTGPTTTEETFLTLFCEGRFSFFSILSRNNNNNNKFNSLVSDSLHIMVAASFTLLFFVLLFRSSTKAVTPSAGCANSNNNGLGSGLQPGQYEDFQRKIPGTQKRSHRLYLPSNYGMQGTPSPVLLYFHGWGGDFTSCGDECSVTAVDKGFVTVTMSGYSNSWKHGGSTGGSRPPVTNPIDGSSPSCAAETQGFCQDYQDSGCDCTDEGSHCGWTTCYDSVEQAMAILDEVQESLCVDLDQVWAMGCSNGGMFTFELARDERSASRLTGIVPIVGLPHYGYSEGPLLGDTKMIGMWGRTDDVVPPISNTNDPNKSSDKDGWYYSVSSKVMSDWTEGKGCIGNGQDPVGQNGEDDWGISKYGNSLTCTQGCSERQDDRIVGCIFEGGHDCARDFMWEPIFAYMLPDEEAPTVTVSLTDTSIAPGDVIEVSYSTSNPKSDDWVAILPESVAVNGVVNWDDVLEWAYLCGSKTAADCTNTQMTGTINLASTGLQNGSYIVYYLCCDGYNVNAQSEPFVISSGPSPTAAPVAVPTSSAPVPSGDCSDCADTCIQLSIMTDSKPAETRVRLKDNNTKEWLKKGNYGDYSSPLTLYTESLCVVDSCFALQVQDKGKNGFGNGGYYSLVVDGETLVDQHSDIGKLEKTSFCTPAPGTSPSPPVSAPTTPPGGCEDASSFKVKNKTRDCSWVASKKTQRCKKFSENCPVTCGTCGASPSPPVSAPTTPPGGCEDASSFKVKNKTRDCSWVASKKTQRCKKFSENCPVTCGTCER